MKKFFVLIVFLIFAGLVMADSIQVTQSVDYVLVRSEIDTAEADPNVTQRNWAYCQASYPNVLHVPRRERLSNYMYANYLNLVFTFNDNAGTATVVIYALRNPTGPITPMEPVCSFTLAAGSQETGEDTTRYFADTAVEVTDPWGIKSFDDDGMDGVTKIEFDTRGYYGFLILFTEISASDDVSCYAAYY